jgi:2-alkenal reductase
MRIRRYLLIVLTACAGLLSACQTTDAQPPGRTAISTPVEALPVSIITRDIRQQPTAVPDAIIDEADAEYMLLANIYERTAPAVVNIEADALNPATDQVELNRGSGFIYDTDGHILTNAHVVNHAGAIRVTFNDGYVTEATLVGVDTYSDLAVIRVQIDDDYLLPLTLTPDSDAVRIGHRAISIGNPFGLNSSMTVGIISGVGRTLSSAELIDVDALPGFQNPSIIQTDTPINPGSSGGPLLNSRGEVVGVTTAIRSESGVFQGVGFAVPADTVRRVVPELIEQGQVDYAWLGITVTPEDNGLSVAGLSEILNLPVDEGVLVRGITDESPADEAGLEGGSSIVQVRGQPVCTGGDIIVAVDGTYVSSMAELVAHLLMNYRPGDTVTFLIVRDRRTIEVPVRLASRPDTETTLRDCEG